MASNARKTDIGKVVEYFLDNRESDISPNVYGSLEDIAEEIDDMAKELEDKIEDLESEVEDLKNKLEQLEEEE